MKDFNVGVPIHLIIANTLYTSAVYFGGVTLDNKGNEVKSGYCVGCNATGLQFDDVSSVNAHTLSEWIYKSGASYFGSWLDSETGKVYFDIVDVFESETEAIETGTNREEIAIFNLSNNEEIILSHAI